MSTARGCIYNTPFFVACFSQEFGYLSAQSCVVTGPYREHGISNFKVLKSELELFKRDFQWNILMPHKRASWHLYNPTTKCQPLRLCLCFCVQELAYHGDEGHNWWSIIFSLLVIGLVVAGIVTAIYLLGYVDELLYWHGKRMQLEEYLQVFKTIVLCWIEWCVSGRTESPTVTLFLDIFHPFRFSIGWWRPCCSRYKKFHSFPPSHQSYLSKWNFYLMKGFV